MSLQVQNNSPNNLASLDDKKAESNSATDKDIADFASLMSGKQESGIFQTNWNEWPGFNPDFQRFQSRVEITETETTVEASINDQGIEHSEKNFFEEFADWFTKGVKHFAEQLGKTLNLLQASVVAQMIASSALETSQIVQRSINKSDHLELPPHIRNQILNLRSNPPEQIATKVGELVSEDCKSAPPIARGAIETAPDQAPQIAAAVTQAAIQAGAAPETLSAISQTAVTAAPGQAPQIAAALTQAAIQAGAAPETLSAISQAAVTAAPGQAPQIAAAITQAAIQAGAAPETLSAISQAAVTAAPGQAPQIAAAITQAAIQAGAAPETLSAISQAAITAAPGQAPQIAAAVTQAAIQAGATPETLSTISQAALTAAPGQAAALSQPLSQEAIQTSGEQAAAELATSAPATGPHTNLQPASVQDSASPRAIPENVLKLIAETVSKISIGETQTTITLKSSTDLPGETTLTIQRSNGHLQVVITATDSRAAQLLNANAAALQNVLKGAAGATQVSVSVAHSDAANSSDAEISPTNEHEKGFRSSGSAADERGVKRGEKSKSSTQ